MAAANEPFLALVTDAWLKEALSELLPWLVGVSVLIASVAQPAGAQVLASTPQCAECGIRLDTVAALGDMEGPGVIPSEGVVLARSPDGMYYVMSAEAQVIQVFDSDATFVHEIGGSGGGPGELRWPVAMYVDERERLYVADAMQQRLTVFDRRFEVERTVRIDPALRPGFGLFPIAGDSVVMNGHSPSPRLFGLPVHVLSPDGARVRSFGEREGGVLARDPNQVRRKVTPGDSGLVWVASSYGEYRVELWTLAGRKIRQLQADVDWLEPIEEEPGHPSPPAALLYQMKRDEDGLLWLQFAVPAERWREAMERDPTASHGWRMVREDYWQDTVIDVVDPSEGRLLARARIPGQQLIKLFGSAGVYSAAKDLDLGEGSYQIQVIRLRLEGWDPSS